MKKITVNARHRARVRFRPSRGLIAVEHPADGRIVYECKECGNRHEAKLVDPGGRPLATAVLFRWHSSPTGNVHGFCPYCS